MSRRSRRAHNNHFDDETLLGYQLEQLAASRVLEVANHLSECAECTARLEDLRQGLQTASQLTGAEESLEIQVTSWLARLGLRRGARFRPLRLLALLLPLATLGYLAGGFAYHWTRQVTLMTSINGVQLLVPGAPTVLRVQVEDPRGQQPVANARVRVRLLGKVGASWDLFEGPTNDEGIRDAHFVTPDLEDGTYQLEVTSQAHGESDKALQEVRLQRRYRLHLSTDKPIYQPGQTIQIRALALESLTRKPAAKKKITLQLLDPKGNRVTHLQLPLSRFGVASARVELDSQVRLGTYRALASLGPQTEEARVKVDRYTLPKLKITVQPDRTFYLAGDTLQATVKATYFFGKPARRARIKAVLFAPETGLVLQGTEIEGRTDDQGEYQLKARLPSGLARFGEPATVMLDVAITDSAGQQEREQQAIPVSRETLILDLVPEGGLLAAGARNTLYVMTRSPAGAPVAGRVEVTLPDGRKRRVKTHENGLGAFTFQTQRSQWGRPLAFNLTAEDGDGHRARRQVSLPVEATPITAATDRAFYRPGQPIRVQIYATPEIKAARIECLQEGQILLSGLARLEKGQGAISAALPPEIRGTIRLDLFAEGGRRPLLSRTVVVADPRGLKVTLTRDQPVYRPGQPARLRFQVRDPSGKPRVAAIGLTVVDRSLLALASSASPSTARAALLLDPALQNRNNRYKLPAVSTLFSDKTDWSASDQLAGKLLFSMLRTGGVKGDERFERSTGMAKLHAMVLQRSQFEEHAGSLAKSLGLAMILILMVVVPVLAAHRLIINGKKTHLERISGGARLDPSTPAGWGWSMLIGLVVLLALILTYLLGLGPREQGLRLLDGSAEIEEIPDWLKEAARRPARVSREIGTSRAQRDAQRDARRLAEEMARNAGVLGLLKSASGSHMASVFGRDSGDSLGGLIGGTIGSSYGIGGLGLVGKGGAKAIPRRQVRVRRRFPETLYVHPELVTDERGVAELTIPLADSITDWQIRALASDTTGQLGALSRPLRVFQDFFVDLDLPVAVVRGDVVSIPIAIHNYLSAPQQVRLELEAAPWFEVVDAPTGRKLRVNLAPDGVEGRDLRIRVLRAGKHRLRLRADGTRSSDALSRELLVTEAGQARSVSRSGVLAAGKPTSITLHLPEAATVRSSRLLVKLFPSPMSMAMSGLESGLRRPHGCFEQTSSTTYPNVLIVQHLKRARKLRPETSARALRYIRLGYQRLLTFEARGGGFGWFGGKAGDERLTAYGLLEFSDMNKVIPVDPELIRRTQRWLLSKQRRDGSWRGRCGSRLACAMVDTAYITWALAESGYRGPALDRALGYLDQRRSKDPYALALVLAAMARVEHPSTQALAAALERTATVKKGKASFHASETVFLGRGRSAAIEATALSVYALGLAGRAPRLVQAGLTHLASSLDHLGTWHTTQGTILALRALLHAPGPSTSGKVTVRVNGARPRRLSFNGQSLTPAVLDLGQAKRGLNVVTLESSAAHPFHLLATYSLPWPSREREDRRPLSLGVNYGRSRAPIGGVVPVEARLTYRAKAPSGMVLVSLGLPAGTTPLPEDLLALVRSGRAAKAEVQGSQLHLYLDRLSSGSTVQLQVRLRAKARVRTVGAGSEAYLYYEPEVRDTAPPSPLVVF